MDITEDQRAILLHDEEFYNAILPYIDSIPDFRPQGTIKKI